MSQIINYASLLTDGPTGVWRVYRPVSRDEDDQPIEIEILFEHKNRDVAMGKVTEYISQGIRVGCKFRGELINFKDHAVNF